MFLMPQIYILFTKKARKSLIEPQNCNTFVTLKIAKSPIIRLKTAHNCNGCAEKANFNQENFPYMNNNCLLCRAKKTKNPIF